MRIIVYRDGVSEGEFDKVAETEVEALRSQLKYILLFLQCAYTLPFMCTDTLLRIWKEANVDVNKMPLAKISFIIVGKRHHMRFFPDKEADKDRSGNLKAGFVVDSEITSPYHRTKPDFYLQSHGGLLGSMSGFIFSSGL